MKVLWVRMTKGNMYHNSGWSFRLKSSSDVKIIHCITSDASDAIYFISLINYSYKSVMTTLPNFQAS